MGQFGAIVEVTTLTFITRSAGFEVAHFRNREAMAARSRGRQPTGNETKHTLSREAATAMSRANCCRRFAAQEILTAFTLRANARSYVLPPLRG